MCYHTQLISILRQVLAQADHKLVILLPQLPQLLGVELRPTTLQGVVIFFSFSLRIELKSFCTELYTQHPPLLLILSIPYS